MKCLGAFTLQGSDSKLGRSCLGLNIFLVILSLAFISTLGCEKKKEVVRAEKVYNIKVMSVEKKPVRPYVEAVGNLEANEEVTITAEVDGIIKQIPVDEGSPVSQGTIITSINQTDYRIGVQSAEATLKQARSSKDNAKILFDRLKALYKKGVVSKQEYDNATTRYDVAVQDLDRAQAGLSLANERMGKTTVRSPINGVVKLKMVTTGDFAKAGFPLMRIVQINPLKLAFNVSEKDVGVISKGQDIVFTVDSFPGKEFAGTVKIIYPCLDERSRMLKVEATVPNDSGELKPGLFARVKIYTGSEKQAILVPITSILYEGTKTKVYVMEKEKAREKYIKLGSKFTEMMEVVEGIQSGEQLVTVGQNALTDGVMVNVVK